ncbi:hypothetical protein MGG_17226 [Pyricularia oryzae 70-15]|uniref:Uncharacterized protein n=1 Tax=Pyricularia oryzae (strain 70-15 / ATCC MYA-4617 / FGSC 8958) TaxID=242507 RepID=G4N900_PYRO7|nr:uncharacterized protein MGG_17226 [Pyricularia oryzae 70-15]EHA51095.1 hypothetical protein MGG_17226 [Pyricularia oryzae 70-15]
MPKVGGQKGCDESELPPLGLRIRSVDILFIALSSSRNIRWGQINNNPQPKIGQVTTKTQVFGRNSCFSTPHVCFRSTGVSIWKEGLFVSRLL